MPQKETAIDQQKHSYETLICQRHQTILRLLSSAATASTGWRVRELYWPTSYIFNRLVFITEVERQLISGFPQSIIIISHVYW